ncbi:hypothetical protein J6590_082082 [Homalodisca vitripennis]|nr:hypothetical protein J6590_082082 [Homalodisca vitripennis]
MSAGEKGQPSQKNLYDSWVTWDATRVIAPHKTSGHGLTDASLSTYIRKAAETRTPCEAARCRRLRCARPAPAFNRGARDCDRTGVTDMWKRPTRYHVPPSRVEGSADPKNKNVMLGKSGKWWREMVPALPASEYYTWDG